MDRPDRTVFLSGSMSLALAICLIVATPHPGASTKNAQTLDIGIIDFYGLIKTSPADARAALAFKEGDKIEMSDDERPATIKDSEASLARLPGVESARTELVCCEAGRVIVYVGVQERGAPALHLRAAPHGQERLPADVVQTGEEFSKALMSAVERGDAAEDRSQGHSLMHDPAARAIQERFVTFASRDLELLRRVLQDTGDADERALAAQVLGYAADKQSVVADLVNAMADPSPNVRNNAIRALMVFVDPSARASGLVVRVPAAPFIEFLRSPVWSDRNKASLALMSLSEARDPGVLASLRQSSLGPLVEIARWKSAGHAMPGFMILARIAGYSDADAQRLWDQGKREVVIEAAMKSTGDRLWHSSFF